MVYSGDSKVTTPPRFPRFLLSNVLNVPSLPQVMMLGNCKIASLLLEKGADPNVDRKSVV